jgi:hypothetical protein
MLRWLPVAFVVAVLCGVAAHNVATCVPDLPTARAADLISRAPEFSTYSHLVKVAEIFRAKGSMDSAAYGTFTFRYLNSVADAPSIKANADFRFWDGKWHLNQFDWGCPSDCHVVDVHNDPPKDSDSVTVLGA